MGSSKTSIKTNKSDKQRAPSKSNIEKKNSIKGSSESDCKITQKLSSLSTRNIFSAIGSRLFSGMPVIQVLSQDEQKKPADCEDILEKEKIIKKDEPELKKNNDPSELVSKKIRKGTKDWSRKPLDKKKKSPEETWKKTDRDFRRFKAKYKTGMGNVLGSWVNLLYCVLVLRLNIIKFFQEKLPNYKDHDHLLRYEFQEENEKLCEMIKKAQGYSQERSLYMWKQLEKLIVSRMILKKALETSRGKDWGKDWKGAAIRLAQIEVELEKTKAIHQEAQKSSNTDKLLKLEKINVAKVKEIENIIEEIANIKKKESQMKGRSAMLSMKNYKDLSNKKKRLLNIEKELNQLKNDQNTLMNEYTNKIQSLKNQIEEKEKLIKVEKEERRKLKSSLDGLGDS